VTHETGDEEGRIAGELVGKIAEIVGARPVFAADLLSQEELLTAVRKLTAQPAPSGWQPIESAPKDFTPVLLWWIPPHGDPCVVLARWMCRTHGHTAKFWDCPNHEDCRMGWDRYAGEFTHWMPLPPAPWQNAVDALPHASEVEKANCKKCGGTGGTGKGGCVWCLGTGVESAPKDAIQGATEPSVFIWDDEEWASLLKSLESGLTALQAFMGEGRHLHTCSMDEDGPCDCGYVDPDGVVEALLEDVVHVRRSLAEAAPSPAKDAIPLGPEGLSRFDAWMCRCGCIRRDHDDIGRCQTCISCVEFKPADASAEDRMANLFNAFADDVERMPDEELIAEIVEDGGDPDAIAEKTRRLLADTVERFKAKQAAEADASPVKDPSPSVVEDEKESA
jgi:hypothetical protein